VTLPPRYNHPAFIAANADRLKTALAEVPAAHCEGAHVAFTAHSIPVSMADNCRYAEQLQETCRLVCAELAIPESRYALVYQSRSGRPTDPWLGPDIREHLTALAGQGVRDVVVMPIGFLSDHVEVLYDLDVEARDRCRKLGIEMVRAATVGTHPLFVGMLADLIEERLNPGSPQPAIGRFGPSHDTCPPNCCTSPPTPATL
jgi:protoporphyrin/coproporphyrin ferrochelatase